ncbi:MAG TPA: hypothetical protein VHD55_02830 [Candidatus Paceibacterota bacterium]|nr:hypothetical protein [Candidatus Paceibacterota bacterium]
MHEKKTFRDTFLRVVALLGVILVLLLGAWGIILLAFNLSSIVGGVGSSLTSLMTGTAHDTNDNGTEEMTLTVPSSAVASGQSFSVSWNHSNKDGEYSYALSFSCASGLSIQAPTPAGKSQTVACGSSFNYTGATSNMTLTAKNTAKQAANTTITVLATRLSDGAITASASADVTVNPAVAAAAPVTAPASTGASYAGATYYAAPRATALYGYPDLSVRILSVNSLSSRYGSTAAQFEIANVGSNTVPAGWNLSADIPVDGGYAYSSPAQQALYPGDRIVYTLTFDEGYRSRDSRSDDERYDECDESHNSWDEEDWMDWYQDAWDTSSHSRDDWDTDEWEDWYDEYCDDYDRNDDRYDSRGGTLTITADPRNWVRELNEGNNTVSVRTN